MNQQIGYTRHDEKLGTGTDKDVQGTVCQYAEIIGGECQAHRQHDDAKNGGLCGATNPNEKPRYEKRQYGDGGNEKRGMVGKPTAHVLKITYHATNYHFFLLNPSVEVEMIEGFTHVFGKKIKNPLSQCMAKVSLLISSISLGGERIFGYLCTW